MEKQKHSRTGTGNIRGLALIMILGYASIIIVSILIVSLLAINKTDNVLKKKVSSLVSSLNVQMKLNMNSYLARMESIGTLAFASEDAYTYDSTAEDNDEYEAINTEKAISDTLYSFCIMENFLDYGIVYRDNHTVGKVSNGTTNLFGDPLFNDLSAMVSRQRTHDGWYTGYKGNFNRIYYVKMIHENALLVISFYATELESVFDNPQALADMDVRLTDKNYNIIYSSVNNEVGTALSDELVKRVVSKDASTILDDSYLVTVNSCGEDWLVICSIPTEIILKEKNEMQYYIIMVAVIAAILAILVSIELSIIITRPVNSVVTNLDSKASTDQLTGLLNKKSFEELTEKRLDHSLTIEPHAVILLDIDNFKGVNDTLGHAYGDQVLAKTGSILRSVFSDEDYLGRIGGDEFCVLINSIPADDRTFRELVKARCEQLCEAFRSNYTGDDGKYKISASIGAALFPDNGSTFTELYAASDKALYLSKKKRKRYVHLL